MSNLTPEQLRALERYDGSIDMAVAIASELNLSLPACLQLARELKASSPATPAIKIKGQPAASGMRQCHRCLEYLFPDAFRPHAKMRDGLAPWCRECERQYQRTNDNRTKQRQQEASVEPGMKRCERCQEVKPLDMFAKNRSSKDGHYYWCHDCRTPNMRGYLRENEDVRKGLHGACVTLMDRVCDLGHERLGLELCEYRLAYALLHQVVAILETH